MTALRAESPVGYVAVHLTEREQRVLQLLADGQDGPEIAIELVYAERTIKNIVADLLVKFGAGTRAQLIHEAHRHGWLSAGEDSVAGFRQRLVVADKRIESLESEVRSLRSRISGAISSLRGEAYGR